MLDNLIILMAILFILVSCFNRDNDLEGAFLKADTLDEAIVYADKIERLEERALPIFIEILSVLITEESHINNYGKINICLKSLFDLAQKGIYSNHEATVLISIIQKQKLITDTLITAEILKIITGTDIGYDKNFVESYTVDDENKRLQIINKWESIINAKSDVTKTVGY